jgi:uncharacterized DUF497 family protein
MADLRFDWDPRKAATNLAKHDVAFTEAVTAFSDELALVLADPDHSAIEARFILLGLSAERRVLVVVHCLRASGQVIRIISARPASRRERTQYRERNT